MPSNPAGKPRRGEPCDRSADGLVPTGHSDRPAPAGHALISSLIPPEADAPLVRAITEAEAQHD